MDVIICPKCEHEHGPTGSHEDDVGEMECDECGFAFIVEIEYDPSYDTVCVIHEFGKFKDVESRGETVRARFCDHCGNCELL